SRTITRARKQIRTWARIPIITGCWHMLTTGELYRDPGGDYFSRRDPEHATRRLITQLERLGHHVTLEAAAA
ncbi:MAG: hypothetical protein MSC30_04350, partial [Gaiellaceae bacterium MAG52_C11]|nr:hypothetical protein [Candidatus Gaiellasilicea maunaloa]